MDDFELDGLLEMNDALYPAHKSTSLTLTRRGDFYEAYGDDAETIAEAINIVVTGRMVDGERVPLVGMPYHAIDRYVDALAGNGFEVELVEDRAEADQFAAEERATDRVRQDARTGEGV